MAANGLTARVARTLLTLFGVVTLTFFLGRLTGDPVALMLPQTASADDYAQMSARLGLDQPLLVQYGRYLGSLLQGDLGTSIAYRRPALEVIQERIPATLVLALPAILLSVIIGVPLGIVSAQRRDGWLDRTVMVISLAGQSLPSFFVGIVLVLIFGVRFGWLPTFGSDNAASLVLPTITLVIFPVAIIIRLTRSSMLEVLNAPYMRTARAKGMVERRVIFVHALRNALIPVITVVGLQIAALLTGSAIVETVFAWPGIGALAVQSIGARDFPIIQAIVLITAAAFAVTNTVVDFAYFAIDPRIRG